MAIILPSGFNITNNEPVDARFSLADQTARYGLSSANIYEGLVVYQRDNDTLWILVDTAEVSGPGGWQQITSSELSDTITDRLDSLEGVSGSYATTGSNLFVGNQNINGSVTSSKVLTDAVRFNTSAGVSVGVGELAWNNSDGTLDLGMKGGAVVQQIGQEIFYEVRNETGIQIPNGTAVFASGVTAGSSRITAAPYVADGSVREVRFLGLATENISTGVNGFVTHFGYVKELDTRGTTASSIAVGDETWAVGDVLYVHPTVAGKLTNVAPKHEISVAIVIVRHQSTGVVFVRPNSFGHIDDLHDIQITTGSLVTGSMLEWNGEYFVNNDTFSSSVDNRLDLLESNSSSLQDIFEEKASSTHTLVSGSSQLTSSYDNRYVTLEGDQTIGSTKTFNNIVVNGTGSFAFIQSTTGSSTSIGEAFIILNENTPSSNFAGIKVVDSGSTFTTASFIYDGLNNNWLFQHEGSVDSGSSLAIFGPLSQGGLGTEVGLTENRIPKSVTNHGHHIGDSNISDNGTLITLNSNSQVNGNLVVNGSVSANNLVSGSSQINLGGDLTGTANNAQIASGVIVNDDVNASAGIVYTKLNLNGSEIVSGSTQITKTLQDVTTAGNTTSTSISITNSTASTSKTTGALIVTGGIGTSGDVFAGGDIVAYASSDRRLKDNIQPIQNSLQKINQIGGYSFEWNVGKQDIYKGKDYGVIAQEIEEILPELVDTRENGYKAVKYDKLVSLLIEGIKDLSKQVEVLQQKINQG